MIDSCQLLVLVCSGNGFDAIAPTLMLCVKQVQLTVIVIRMEVNPA